ncbi:MAG TPA: acetate kinase [Candidatus Absconditabacterales bacterium]|nr:acetate kinase [Candidatus Absconditabacterales bacterium]
MKILVINTGSSSLKYQVFDMKQDVLVLKGSIEKIGEEGSSFVDHTQALQSVVDILSTSGNMDIEAIGHRVVHGGEYFKNPVIITDEVIAKITACSDLAPLHNPANLQAILPCRNLFPILPQVAVFDTAFHQTMEPAHYLYALPIKYYETYKIRRYGFHGISHQYIYEKLLEKLKNGEVEKLKEVKTEDLKVITCHIGNGASITAIKGGKVVETSMGMTPLEGLMMGTRSGNIDPAIITYLMVHEHKTAEQIDELLNKRSGLLGISGVSNDMRDIVAGVEQGNPACSLALDMYINALVKYIGAYAGILGGVDVIVLTAGVMEHRTIVRTMLLQRLSWMGVVFDPEANRSETLEKIVTTPDSQVTVLIIPTNEELMIAKETYTLIHNV